MDAAKDAKGNPTPSVAYLRVSTSLANVIIVSFKRLGPQTMQSLGRAAPRALESHVTGLDATTVSDLFDICSLLSLHWFCSALSGF